MVRLVFALLGLETLAEALGPGLFSEAVEAAVDAIEEVVDLFVRDDERRGGGDEGSNSTNDGSFLADESGGADSD
jgi:hypothetical protein